MQKQEKERIMRVLFLNTWGGNVPGYFDWAIETYRQADLICLSEVHNHFGPEETFTFPAKTSRAGPVMLKQFQRLQQALIDTHDGYFSEAYRGYHDCDDSAQTPQGIAMFMRRTLRVSGHCTDVIAGTYGRHWNQNTNTSACRVIQSCQVEFGQKRFLVAHLHGLWTPEGKIDSAQRDTQNNKIIFHLARRMREFGRDENGNCPSIILGGDFNYTNQMNAFAKIAESTLFGPDGAIILNECVDDGYDTRTKFYPDSKPTRQADWVFASSNLQNRCLLHIDRSVPSDHALLEVNYLLPT